MRILAAISAVLCTSCVSTPPQPGDIRFDNGLWYQDGAFVPATITVANNELRFSAVSDAAPPALKVVDLAGGYVVPPFCEAHNHNLGGGTWAVEDTISQYVEDGIFYVMIPGAFKLYRDAIKDQINGPGQIDVAFSNNGITGYGGHPVALRHSLKARHGAYSEFTDEMLADRGYFEVADAVELERKWPTVMAQAPDFIKLMLYASEDYEARKDDPDYYGKRGLDPDLVDDVVRLARESGLRVAAHVETDADVVNATEGGVDLIVHLIGYNSGRRLSDEAIALAVSHDVTFVTTLGLANRFRERAPDAYQKVIELQAENLRRLRAAGVNLVIGSDNTATTSRAEAEHILSLGVFDARTLLDMWSRGCAETVFPNRSIGRLEEGYEASFLVLEENPLNSFSAVSRIRMRVKDGMIL